MYGLDLMVRWSVHSNAGVQCWVELGIHLSSETGWIARERCEGPSSPFAKLDPGGMQRAPLGDHRCT